MGRIFEGCNLRSAAVSDLYSGTTDPSSERAVDPWTPSDPNIVANAARRAVAVSATGIQPASEQANSIREAARRYGFNLDQYQDDGAAFAALVQAAQAGQLNDYCAQVGQRLAPHASQIQKYVAQQTKPALVQERPAYLRTEFSEFGHNFVNKDARPSSSTTIRVRVTNRRRNPVTIGVGSESNISQKSGRLHLATLLPSVVGRLSENRGIRALNVLDISPTDSDAMRLRDPSL